MSPILIPTISLHSNLAGVQHTRQRRLLRTRDSQTIHALNLNPHLRIRAVVACQRGLPLLRALVALSLVDIVGDSEELGVGQVVGEGLAAGCGP